MRYLIILIMIFPISFSFAKSFGSDSIRVGVRLLIEGTLIINSNDRSGFFDAVDPNADSKIDSEGIDLGIIDINHCDSDLQDLILNAAGHILAASDGSPAISDSVNDQGVFYALYDAYFERRFRFNKAYERIYSYSIGFRDTVGSSVSDGQALTINGDGKYDLADASYDTSCIVIGLSSGAFDANNLAWIVTHGYFYKSAWSWTPGEAVYLDATTAGNLTQSRPSSSGQRIVYIGLAISDKLLFINPSPAFLKLE